MLEKHISSKYLATLSYNFSIKVIFIFAFIGNRMDLFYFHKKKQKPSIEWLFSGVISFDKTKNKTHQCNGNFSSFRIYSFFLLLSSSLSYFAMSLRFLLGRGGCCEGVSVFYFLLFPFFWKKKAKQWIEIMVFAVILQPQNAENAFAISPSE
jgi:hypothetical protein